MVPLVNLQVGFYLLRSDGQEAFRTEGFPSAIQILFMGKIGDAVRWGHFRPTLMLLSVLKRYLQPYAY